MFSFCRKFAILLIIFLCPLCNAFADGCDDLQVTIDNKSDFLIIASYTDYTTVNAKFTKDKSTRILAIQKTTIDPKSSFVLPLLINRYSQRLVFADIAFNTMISPFPGKSEVKEVPLLHETNKVISITKHYVGETGLVIRTNYPLDRSLNVSARNCLRQKWKENIIGVMGNPLDNGLVCDGDPKLYNTKGQFTGYATDQSYSSYYLSAGDNVEFTPNVHLRVSAEVQSVGFCAKEPDPADKDYDKQPKPEPARVVIHINPV